MKNPPRRAGFSLVELLVVIAILGVLIALLMPSLSRAKETAMQVACMNNERQIAIAVIAYTTDFLNRVPPSYCLNTGNNALNNGCLLDRPTPFHTGWRQYNGNYPGVGPNPRGVPLRGGHTFPHYLRDARVFYCPDNLYDSPNHPDKNPGLTATTRFVAPDRGSGFALWEQALGSFDTTYAFPALRDDLAPQRRNRGETGSDDYNNWHNVYSGSLLSVSVEQNVARGMPMLWDTSFGPYGVVSGATPITYYNHGLRLANVTYWDGRVLLYPHARYVYDNRNYGYGYRGFTDRFIVSILINFGRGDAMAR